MTYMLYISCVLGGCVYGGGGGFCFEVLVALLSLNPVI